MGFDTIEINLVPIWEGFHKKNMTNFGFWLKLGDGGVREGFKGPTLLYGLNG